MSRDSLPDRTALDALRHGLPKGRPDDPRPTTHDRRSPIEDAARMVGGEAEDDTGPGYIAPAPLSRHDVVGWIFIVATAATGFMAIWLGLK